MGTPLYNVYASRCMCKKCVDKNVYRCKCQKCTKKYKPGSPSLYNSENREPKGNIKENVYACKCSRCVKTRYVGPGPIRNNVKNIGQRVYSTKCQCSKCIKGFSPGYNPHKCTCKKCKPVVENKFGKVSGGFRVLQEGKTKWVPNVVDHHVQGPVTKMTDFYVKAHTIIQETGVPNFVKAKIPVPTSLKVGEWSKRLVDYEDNQIVDLLTYGFPIGYDGDTPPVSDVKNHKGAENFSEFIDGYLNKEVGKNLMLGPLSENPLSVPLMLSPLNTVPKKGEDDRRVICDLSHPKGQSVNDGISKNVYMDTIVNLTYPSVDSLASLLKHHGVGCHIFKKDLKSAYRQFHLDPGDIHYTAYKWNQGIYIDVALIMGSRSSAHLCQRITNSVAFMAGKLDVVMLNYLDDLCCVSSPEVSTKKYEIVTNLLHDLGLVESVEKSVRPGTSVEFLGVLFNTIDQTMEVTPERLVEIATLVKSWLKKSRASKKQLQSLIGKLIFVSRCVFASRIFVSRMLCTLRYLGEKRNSFVVSVEFRKDLEWWDRFLTRFNGTTYIPEMVWKEPDIFISTDACLTGTGGWCGSQFFSEKFPDSVISKDYHINVLELLSILVALRLWYKECSGLRLKFNCDNLLSVNLINSGRSRDANMLRVIREIVFLCATHNIHILAVHLPGVQNRRADALSRAHVNSSVNFSDIMGSNATRCEVRNELFDIKDRW